MPQRNTATFCVSRYASIFRSQCDSFSRSHVSCRKHQISDSIACWTHTTISLTTVSCSSVWICLFQIGALWFFRLSGLRFVVNKQFTFLKSTRQVVTCSEITSIFFLSCWAHVLMLRMCVHYKLYLWLAAHVWDCAKRMFNGTHDTPLQRPLGQHVQNHIFLCVCVSFHSFVLSLFISIWIVSVVLGNLVGVFVLWKFVSPILDSVRQ